MSATLHHAAREQGVDGQFLPDLLNIHLFAFIAENGVAGFHLQLGHMGEAVDQGFGESVAEEIGVGIAAHSGEGDHGDGLDL